MLQNPHGSSNLTAYSLSPARLSLSAAGAKGQCMDLANITWRDLLWLRVLKRTSYIGKITKAARENIHRTWEAQQLLFPYIIPKKVSVPRLQRKLAPWSVIMSLHSCDGKGSRHTLWIVLVGDFQISHYTAGVNTLTAEQTMRYLVHANQIAVFWLISRKV
jgi:hypothetical protein